MNKKQLIVLIMLSVSAVAFILIAALNAMRPKQPPLAPPASPPGTASSPPPQPPSPQPSQTWPQPLPLETPRQPSVQLDPAKSDLLLKKIKSRAPLSNQDSGARKKLVSLLGGKSGVLNKTDTYRLEYVAAPNIFLAEILTTDLTLAKQEAVSWLEAQNLSGEGICNLPLSFYLNSEVSKQLTGKGLVFNPLPDNCQ